MGIEGDQGKLSLKLKNIDRQISRIDESVYRVSEGLEDDFKIPFGAPPPKNFELRALTWNGHMGILKIFIIAETEFDNG